MWVVTTSDGREYKYESYEMALLSAQAQSGWDGYSIVDEDEIKETETDESL